VYSNTKAGFYGSMSDNGGGVVMVKSRLPQGIMLGLLLVGYAAGAVQTLIPIADQSRISQQTPIDKLIYIVIPEEDKRISALQDDDLGLIGHFVDPSYVPELEASENIETETTSTNSYVALSINCRKYPLNLTAFRRAVAYALDKEGMARDQWPAVPLDSVVARASPFTIEGMSEDNYYAAQFDTSERLLDEAGFFDQNGDGIREAPDGSAFDVLIEYVENGESEQYVCEAAATALNEVGINSSALCSSFIHWPGGPLYGDDYDIFYIRFEIEDLDVWWLAYEYWSEYADTPLHNIPGFRNHTYDSYREALLQSVEYDDVYEAALEMQRILDYECPVVVCYEELGVSAYRTDVWWNQVNMPVSGVLNWWTNCYTTYGVHGGYGGTFRIGIPHYPKSFNPLTRGTWDNGLPMSMMFDSLARRNVYGDDVPFLATDWTTETHDDDSSVPEGFTRITFQLAEWAIWRDGTSLTAEDVVYSINLFREHGQSTETGGMDSLVAAYSKTPSTVVTEFSTESYWNLHEVCFIPVLQKRQCVEMDLLEWEPRNLGDFLISHGPFFVSEFVRRVYFEMIINPDYYYLDNPADTPTSIGGPFLNGVRQSQFTIVEGTTGNMVTWSVFGYLYRYEVYVDSVSSLRIDLSPSITGRDVDVNVDGLAVGVHSILIVLEDRNGTITSDTVTITVVSSTSLFVTGFLTGLIATIAIGISFLCVEAVKRKRCP
jgi:ABC-type transport system substrate-binding protein